MSDAIWKNNLRDALLLDQLVLIHGNIKDLYAVEPAAVARLPEQYQDTPFVNFDIWLALELERLGYPIVTLYDPIDGVVFLRNSMRESFVALASGNVPVSTSGQTEITSKRSLPKATTDSPEQRTSDRNGWMARWDVMQAPAVYLRTLYSNVFPVRDAGLAAISRFTDRYLSYSDRQADEDKILSLLVQKAVSCIPPAVTGNCPQSRLILIFNTEGEIPQELNIQCPFARSVLIPSPTVEAREEFFRFAAKHFYQGDPDDRFQPESDSEHLSIVANSAEGLKMHDLLSMIELSRRERIGLGKKQFKNLLDRFRFGNRENAWLKVKSETLRNAKASLQVRVKGQDEVIDEVIPVLIRAKLGMSDLSKSKHSSKPRGAFFFVGPTGVGKTELAKSIAELIFGDEKALIRFDMSEYSEEHQQARLVGAPPGYVGFDQGGQLTNAILERPFSVILFDEIEKAHGRILDKFLQVLDDGRLTDGMGRTVYFSEAILVFTSNIGTSPRTGPIAMPESKTLTEQIGESQRNVEDVYQRLAELSYPDLCDHFRSAVKQYFVNTLGRPEILNRIGEDNILVFNFLQNEDAKMQIIDRDLRELNDTLQSKFSAKIYCTNAFKRLLMTHPSGFNRNGARGVRNLLEKLVINPLSEQVFLEPEKCHGRIFRVDYKKAVDRIAEEPFEKSALEYEWLANDD
ncbi:MAG: AAA family ATPase [Pirellulaceae bacterium]|nr:AAA family ATPase [Pirellulaceae bacterium]